MLISIVKRSQLNVERRIDAEYYKPSNLAAESLVKAKPYRLARSLCTFVSGPFGSTVTTDKYSENSNCRYIRGKDVQDFFVDDSDRIFIQPDLFKALSQYHLQPLNILVTAVGMNFGKAAIIFPDDLPAIFSCKSSLLKDLKVNPFYLTAYCASKYGYALIRRGQRGAAQPGINLLDLRDIAVPTFSSKLEDFTEALVKKARILVKNSLAQYAQAEETLLAVLRLETWHPRHTLTYLRRFSEALRFRRMDAEHFQPRYDDIRKKVEEYPNGCCAISEITAHSQEMVEPANNPENEYSYVELANINQAIGVIERANQITGKQAPSRARMFLRTGDVIASTVQGSLDKVAVVSAQYHGAIGSTGFFVLRPRTVESGYLLVLVKSIVVREQMCCEASGTILAAVSSKSLENIIVPKVETQKQEEISSLVQRSHAARKEANALMDKAKRAVEIAIEDNENTAIDLLKS
jgi:restriction endonuclease S subunit